LPAKKFHQFVSIGSILIVTGWLILFCGLLWMLQTVEHYETIQQGLL
jgi:hypothetical protein